MQQICKIHGTQKNRSVASSEGVRVQSRLDIDQGGFLGEEPPNELVGVYPGITGLDLALKMGTNPLFYGVLIGRSSIYKGMHAIHH